MCLMQKLRVLFRVVVIACDIYAVVAAAVGLNIVFFRLAFVDQVGVFAFFGY